MRLVDAPAAHVGIVEQSRARFCKLTPKHRHHATRREMTVERIVHGTRDRHADVRLEIRGGSGSEHVGGHTKLPGIVGDPGLLLEAMLGVAERQQSVLGQLELVAPAGDPLLIAIAAREMEIAQHGRGGCDARRGRGTIELPAPIEQFAAETRLHVKWTLRIPHPAQPKLHDARARERDEVAWHDHPGVRE